VLCGGVTELTVVQQNNGEERKKKGEGE